MRWITRLLRPETVPHANKKNLSFWTSLRLDLYHNRLLRLRKQYARYACSDSITLQGNPDVKVVHERRDPVFEAELRRMRLLPPDQTKAREGLSATGEKDPFLRPYYREFRFEDTLSLTVGEQVVSIRRGEEEAFRSAIKGTLRESTPESLIQRYLFTGSMPPMGKASEGKPAEKSPSKPPFKPSETPPKPEAIPSKPADDAPGRHRPKRPAKTGPLFGDDPLLGQTHPGSAPAPAPEPPKSTKKTVAGVVIDESF